MKKNFWLLVGSQTLYGDDVLRTVDERAAETVLSYDVSAEMMKDFANMMGIEFVHINKDTTVDALEEKLMIADLVWKLK